MSELPSCAWCTIQTLDIKVRWTYGPRLCVPCGEAGKLPEAIKGALARAVAEATKAAAEALESAHSVMVFDARDWGESSKDAWLYGLFVGWGTDECYADILQRHPRWKPDGIERLKRLRAGLAAIYDGDLAAHKDGT